MPREDLVRVEQAAPPTGRSRSPEHLLALAGPRRRERERALERRERGRRIHPRRAIARKDEPSERRPRRVLTTSGSFDAAASSAADA